MTPAARIAAAAEILDDILAGEAAEKTLTNWARRRRFAGSSDRAAIRDHVFDALRCKRSYAVLGGAATGRGLMIGALRAQGADLAEVFTGLGHSPAVLSDEEAAGGATPEGMDALDLQDWQWPILERTLGAEAAEQAQALRLRADVFLRINTKKADLEQCIEALSLSGVIAEPHQISPTALVVRSGGRKVAQSEAYTDGLVELQDGASQAVIDMLPLRDGMRILDFCAGGGGKALAMAARVTAQITASDQDPNRMKDIKQRADRAGEIITIVEKEDLEGQGLFDLVLCDAPCSGSGAWRRAPEGKWALTPERLDELCSVQAEILEQAAQLVAPDGVLAYATCSMFDVENQRQVEAFCQGAPKWRIVRTKQWTLAEGGDGFFCAILAKDGM